MLNHQRVTFPLGCLFLPWSQELQFVEDVVLVYGGWADPGAVPHGVPHGMPEPSQGSMASLESFKLRQVRIPEMGQFGPGANKIYGHIKKAYSSAFLSLRSADEESCLNHGVLFRLFMR